MLSNNKLSFVTNNIKGIQSLKKKLKLIQYYQSKIEPCGLLFLQETHSKRKVEEKWKEDFHGKVSFLTEKQILVLSLLLTSELKNLPLKNNKQIRAAVF